MLAGALIDELNIAECEETLCALVETQPCNTDTLYEEFMNDDDAPKEIATDFVKEPVDRDNDDDVCPNFVPTALMAGETLVENIAILS
jgi:hypothetical protein